MKCCETCQTTKVRPSNKVKLVITQTRVKPFQIIVIDTIGPLPESSLGNKYALTLICDMTKYLVTIALPYKKINIF